jgi:hypothetical protein
MSDKEVAQDLHGIKDIAKVRYAARYYARKHGASDEEAEDFAQEATMQWANGRKATPSQLYADFLRRTKGDTRAGGDSAKPTKEKLIKAIYLDSLVDTQDRDGNAYRKSENELTPVVMPNDTALDLYALLRPLRGQSRAASSSCTNGE